ncbi:MAG: hypothetical protein IJ002_04005 [Clostridia bacterium]|nr:hypothetical protein [Clostridia bacterium]
MKQKRLCSTCETGVKTYNLDPLAESCQYVYCYKNGRCAYYKPIKTAKKSFFSILFGKK